MKRILFVVKGLSLGLVLMVAGVALAQEPSQVPKSPKAGKAPKSPKKSKPNKTPTVKYTASAEVAMTTPAWEGFVDKVPGDNSAGTYFTASARKVNINGAGVQMVPGSQVGIYARMIDDANRVNAGDYKVRFTFSDVDVDATVNLEVTRGATANSTCYLTPTQNVCELDLTATGDDRLTISANQISGGTIVIKSIAMFN